MEFQSGAPNSESSFLLLNGFSVFIFTNMDIHVLRTHLGISLGFFSHHLVPGCNTKCTMQKYKHWLITSQTHPRPQSQYPHSEFSNESFCEVLLIKFKTQVHWFLGNTIKMLVCSITCYKNNLPFWPTEHLNINMFQNVRRLKHWINRFFVMKLLKMHPFLLPMKTTQTALRNLHFRAPYLSDSRKSGPPTVQKTWRI